MFGLRLLCHLYVKDSNGDARAEVSQGDQVTYQTAAHMRRSSSERMTGPAIWPHAILASVAEVWRCAIKPKESCMSLPTSRESEKYVLRLPTGMR